MASQPAAQQASSTRVQRYHGLDGLRGLAMLLGIVLHATLPYFSRIAGLEYVWPADDDQSVLMFLVFDFVHVWRMPVFFLMAGFFAHLVMDRRSVPTFVLDRLKRIALPLVLFGALVAVSIRPIWVYGWHGVISIEASLDVMTNNRDLVSSGELVGHMWFLYYLLLMYAALVCFLLLRGLRLVREFVGTAAVTTACRYACNAAYTLPCRCSWPCAQCSYSS